MARVEQKYLVDKKTLGHLIAMLRDGIATGASHREIREQMSEILDPQCHARTDQAVGEMNAGKVKRFKNAEQMIKAYSAERLCRGLLLTLRPSEETTKTESG